MYELMLLTGQEYVDEYASKFKGNDATGVTQGQPPAREPGSKAS
jgi:hypothetical protein